MIEDLRNVQKQHFEMENINESLEQRIEQLKGQRDLSLLLVKTGQEHELKSHHEDADNQKAKLTKLLSGTQQSWQEKLIEKMRDLDDAMRKASEVSINLQVQKNMEQIRTQNQVIVELTRKKEEYESKKLREI